MQEIIDINNEACSLWVTINSKQKCKYRVLAEDLHPQSKYADRVINVYGERQIYLSFPVSPKKIKLTVSCLGDKANTQFTVKSEKKDLKTYEIHLDQNTKQFLDLSIPFAQVCGFEQPTPTGRIWKADKFVIKYFPVIRDYMTGNFMNTPARIGHNSGIIEVSAAKFQSYTIPMRMMILLHEFSHKWKNPQINLPIGDESGADINALYIFLGLGFSKVCAIYVYSNVFFKAQTTGNIQRMRKIMNYIHNFENEEYAKRLT